MTESKNRLAWQVALALAVLLVSAAPAVWAQDVGFDVQGPQLPGGTVRVTANPQSLGGATVQSFKWTQIGGLHATLNGANAKTVAVKVPARFQFRKHLVDVINEPPIGPEDLPPNVPAPPGEFPAGLQNRFTVVGLNPFDLEEAGLITLQVEVKTTTAGTIRKTVELHIELPWTPTAGIRNVPLEVPVLLWGKEQKSYNWQLTRPAGSSATLGGPTSRSPEFTPDVAGIYEVRITDQAAHAPVVLTVYAGNYRGVIVGEDAAGRPIPEGLCTACHNGVIAEAAFDTWKETGHAEIFTQLLDTNTHNSTNCFACHAVGFLPGAENGGIDDADDFQAFLGSGLINNPGDNWSMVLEDYPATAQLANVQCENCHGPAYDAPRQDTLAHGWRSDVDGEPRVSLSANVCGQCHGEPMRHGRFQQWQLSAHANYEVAIEESTSGSCARCHTVNGFLQWLPILLGDVPGDPTANIKVTWTEDEAHPQTCATCHDPHNTGTTSGIDTNARVRISGNTPDLIAGFQVVGAGRGAICMTCHNSRRGLHNDSTFVAGASDNTRAPHGSSQTDVLMGENGYFVNTGVRGRHSLLEDTCVKCHMEKTPPPALLSYNQSGTNHTFFASKEVCTECHEGITAENLENIVEARLEYIKEQLEDRFVDFFKAQIAAGNKLSFDGTVVGVASNITGASLTEGHGQMALDIHLKSGTLEAVPLGDIDVVQPAPLPAMALQTVIDNDVLKAGWNWFLVHNDGSEGAHNPRYVLELLDGAADGIGATGGPRARLDLF